jgi:anthranilate phosphoribosyltransferase
LGVVAYTLVRTNHHEVQELVNEIKKLQFIEEITPVYGEYDIVVKTETNSIKELTLFVYNKLRLIPGLTATKTMITAKIPEK